jgi:Ca2+/Na+ antiporter
LLARGPARFDDEGRPVFSTIHARLYTALVASFCLLGLCLAFAQPVYSLPDEPAHWLTAHVRLEHLFGRKGCVPTVLGTPCPKEHICSTIPVLELTCANDIGLYGDALTYPGVLLSKLILPRQTESAIRQVQAIVLSRLLQGLIVILCLLRVGVLARKTGRFGSITLAALTLSPLLAQQAFAVSSDGAQLAFGMCLFAAVMFWDVLTRLDVVMFLLLGYPSTAKPTLLPLLVPAVCAGFWLAQADQGHGLREIAHGFWRSLKPTRAPVPQTLILWSALLLSLLTVAVSLSYDAAGQAVSTPAENASRIAHLNELRAHPFKVFDLVNRLRYPTQVRTWVSPLGWLDLNVSPALVNAFSRLFVLCSGLDLLTLAWLGYRRRAPLQGTWRRLGSALPGFLLGLLGALVNVLFINAVMYVLWTPLNAHRAWGVQYRYFFPASMVVVAVLFRTLEVLLQRSTAPANELPQRALRWFSVVAPCLVLVLSLPYVARLYVDLSVRYHNPAAYPRHEPHAQL